MSLLARSGRSVSSIRRAFGTPKISGFCARWRSWPTSALFGAVIALAAAFAPKAQAQVTWNGTTSTDWAVGTNWSTGIVPDFSTPIQTAVLINQSTGNQPVDSNALIINGGNVTVSNGAALTANQGILINNGNFTIDGAGSTLSLAGMQVGIDGIGSFTVSNGASVHDTFGGAGQIGSDGTSSANATVTVTGTNSVLVLDTQGPNGPGGNGGAYTIGWGHMDIANGGRVNLTGNGGFFINLPISVVNLNSGGILQVDGAGGVFGAGTLNFAGGKFQVTNTTLVASVNATLATNTTSTIDTNGHNATWSGNIGGLGALKKLNTAGTLKLTGTNTYAGGTEVRGGTLSIDGGSVSHPDGDLYIGSIGESAHLTIVNGGTMEVGEASTADTALSIDSIVVDGANSSLTVDETLTVGAVGNTTLTVSNGGTVSVTGADGNGNSLFVGFATGSHGTVNVTGANSTFEVTEGAATFGLNGHGNLSVNNGGNATFSGADVAGNGFSAGIIAGSTSNISVADAGSVLNVTTGVVNLGYLSNATFTVSNGGVATFGGVDGNGVAVYLGTGSGGNGTAIITGDNIEAEQASTLNVTGGMLVVGMSGNGNLTVVNGGSVTASGVNAFGNAMFVGFNEDSNGTVNVSDSGSTLTVANGALVDGYSGNGNINVTNGGYLHVTGVAEATGVSLYIGLNSVASLNVMDAGSNLTIDNGPSAIGWTGNGTLSVTNGGVVNSSGADSQSAAYIGYNADSTGLVSVADAGSTWTTSNGDIVVGQSGNGTLLITNGGTVNSGGQNGAGVGIYIGAESGSSGNVTVSGNGSLLNVSSGSIYLGQTGDAILKVLSGGNLYSTGNDTNGVGLDVGGDVSSSVYVSGKGSSATFNGGTVIIGDREDGRLDVKHGASFTVTANDDNDIAMYVGYAADTSGTICITGVDVCCDTQSSLSVYGALAVGYNGNGYLTVSNGGYLKVDSDRTAYLGYNEGSSGTMTISGVQSTTSLSSQFDMDSGALYVGKDGNGTLTVSDGAKVNASGNDNGLAVVIGEGANSTSSVTVTGVNGDILRASVLLANGGAMVVGDNGTGNLTVANGGYVNAAGFDDNDIGLYVGRNEGANGSILVTDTLNTSEGVYYGELDITNGALVVGYNGNATLAIANGGYVHADSSDDKFGTYIGYGANSTSSLTITGAVNTDDGVYQSEFDNEDRALAIGYSGNGSLTISNAGYAGIYGADDCGIGLYLGFASGSTGNLTVTDILKVCGDDVYQSEIDITDGALVVGYRGTGSVSIANGGFVDASGPDDNGVTAYIGYKWDSSGTVTVDGARRARGDIYQSEFDVKSGALVVGYKGTGNLSVTNGGYVNVGGQDESDVSVYVGYKACSTGTITVDGINSCGDTASHLYINESLVLADCGVGTLTVTNGGTVCIGGQTTLGQGSNGSGMLVIDGTGSYLGSGPIIVGDYGTGSVSITNGGNLTTNGSDEDHSFGAYIGWHGSSNSSVSVDGVGSTWTVADAPLVVGNWGTGTLSLTNGGNVTAGNDNGDDPYSLYIGRGRNGVGTITVSDLITICCNTYASTLTVNNGALVIGYDGTGTLSVANGGNVKINGLGEDNLGTVLGHNEGSNGTLTIDGANSYVDGGPLLVGDYGNGSVSITNGGTLDSNNVDSDHHFGAYIGWHGSSNSSVSVDGLYSSWLVGSGSLIVGNWGTGTLTITNGGSVNANNDHFDNDTALIIGRGRNGDGTVIVTDTTLSDPLDPDSTPVSSTLTVNGSLAVGYNGQGNLTVANGGLVNVAGIDGGLGVLVGGYQGTGYITVDGSGSTLNVTNGSMVVDQGGNGTVTVSNGGLVNISGNDGNHNGLLLASEVLTGATVNVQDNGSELDVNGGATIVGQSGPATLNITNFGQVYSNGTDGNGIAAIVGQYSNGNGTVLVQGGVEPLEPGIVPAGDPASLWEVQDGATIIGYNSGSHGDVTASAGGIIDIEGSDCHDVGLYIGYNCCSSGTLTITDSSSELNISAATVIGYKGTGSLTVSNGGSANLSGSDSNHVSLYLGKRSDGDGTLLVTDADSQLNVSDSVMVGYKGTGNLTVANGGQVTVYGSDCNGVSMYIGYNCNAEGAVTVTGLDTQLRMTTDGSIVAGYSGTGNLSILDGGRVQVDSADHNSLGLILGYNSGANGTVVVSDIHTIVVEEETFTRASELDVNFFGGATVVGYNGTGNLTVANGGYAQLSGHDDNGLALVIGYNEGANGSVTVTDTLNTDNGVGYSELDVNNSALAVGYNGNGTLTVANGGYVDASGSDDNGIGAYIGLGANSTSTVTVTDAVKTNDGVYQSELDVDSGALAIGYNGHGIMTVANGAQVDLDGTDDNRVALYLGYGSGSTGDLTVTDILKICGEGVYQSQFFVDEGSIIVGYHGTGNLSIANGGYLETEGSDDNGIAVYLGYKLCSTGTLTVDGARRAQGDTYQSKLDIEDGALVIGYRGTGNVSVTNGGLMEAYASDENAVSVYIGYKACSSGTLTVDGINCHNCAVSEAYIDDSLVLGNCGVGTLTVTNGGLVTVQGQIVLGQGSNGSGTINLTNNGTLEIGGGENGLAVGDGSYAVNLDGGRIRVINNDLTTSLNITLNNCFDLSVIDTNGYSATLSGLISGSGGLEKDGSGNLTLAASETYTGDTNVRLGGLVVDGLLGGNIGTFCNSSGDLYVGGPEASLYITNGAAVYAGEVSFANHADDFDTIVVDGAGSLLHATGDFEVGNYGTANLTVSNGGIVNAAGETLTIGANEGSNGTVYVTDTNSTLSVGGGLYVGDFGNGSLTVANGGNITATFLAVGHDQGGNGTVLITDPTSVLSISGFSYIGNSGLGNLTVANGGTMISTSGSFNIANESDGSVTVDGANSTLQISGALNVGLEGEYNGTLTVSNGGNVTAGTLVVGDDSSDINGTVLVTDANSTLTVNAGTTIIGNSGTGNLTVANSGFVNLQASDCHDVGLYVGYNCCTNGTILVTDADSELDISAATVIGYKGTGSLTVANGGTVYLNGSDSRGVALYLGEHGNGNGSVLVTDADSFLQFSSGAAMIGYKGTGNLTVANGAHVTSSGSDCNGISMYIGYNCDASGSVLVTDKNSQMLMTADGSIVAGYNGQGSLTVANGGRIAINVADDNSFGLILGYNSGGNGTVLISDVFSNCFSALASNLTIGSGALVVGYNGTGNLTVANGGYANVQGSDDNSFGVVLGYNDGSTGNLTITDTLNTADNSVYRSALDVSTGALVVGYNGNSTMTIANGGAVEVDGTDNNGHGVIVGYGANSTSSLTITGTLDTSLDGVYRSYLDNEVGAMVIGYSGNGTMTIANAGFAANNGSDDNGIGVYLGRSSGSTGNLTVTDILKICGEGVYQSGFDIYDGALAVGYCGTGTLSIANGGYVNAEDSDSNGITAYLGYKWGSQGTISVDGARRALGDTYQSELDIDDGAMIVGYRGTGNVSVTNGGLVDVYSSDENDVSVYVGYKACSTGTITVDGINSCNDAVSAMYIDSSLVLGNCGVGTLTVSNGGVVSVRGQVLLAQGSNGNGTINLTNNGTLEVGNSVDGIAVGDGTYAINMDGGRIRVINSAHGPALAPSVQEDLTTSANITLNDCFGLSIIDTNGYNALFSGVISGSGGLEKDGSGNLTLANDMTYTGGTTVRGGTLILNGNSITHPDADMIIAQLCSDTANLSLTNASIYVNNLIIGDARNTIGNATLDHGFATLNGTLVVGSHGDGSLLIKNFGGVTVNGADDNGISVYVGAHKSGTGNLTVDDGVSFLEVNDGAMAVGYKGTGNFTVDLGSIGTLNGVNSSGISLLVGYNLCSNGTVLITDEDSALTTNGSIIVGYNGQGSLTIANGGAVNVLGGDGANVSVYVGYNTGANGSVLITDEGTKLTTNGSIAVGASGNGSFTIANGASVEVTGANLGGSAFGIAGNGGNGSVLVTDDFTSLTLDTGYLLVGYNGEANMTIANGARVTAPYTQIVAVGGNGTLNIDSGGKLATGNVSSSSSSAGSLTFNGGILQATGNSTSFVNFVPVTLNSEGGGIYTNGFDVSVNSAIGGSGNLSKTGAGNLTLTNVNTFTGNTFVFYGNLIIDNSLALQYSTLQYDAVNGNVTFGYSNSFSDGLANFVLGGLNGDKDIDLSDNAGHGLLLQVGNNGNDTVYSGNLTDSGNFGSKFVKIGDGTLGLSGNNTFTAGLYVDGGLVSFDNNSNLGTGNVSLADGGLFWNGTNTTDVSSRLFLNSGEDTINTNGNDVTFASNFGGFGTLVKDGEGVLTLTGNDTWSGGTIVAGGSLIIDGINGTSLSSNEDLIVGSENGMDASYTLTNGAFTTYHNVFVSYGIGINGTVLVTGSNATTNDQSFLNVTNVLLIGLDFSCGASANVTIADGGHLQVTGFGDAGTGISVGANEGSNGTLLVTNASMYNQFGLTVGEDGTGNFTLANGGTLFGVSGNTTDGYNVVAGYNSGSNGTITVTDADSQITALFEGVQIGRNGNGTLIVSNGGMIDITDANNSVTTVGLSIAFGCSATGNVFVTDSGSTISVANGFDSIVGDSGTGYLTVSNGALVSFSGTIAGGNLTLGHHGSGSGTVMVTGANSDILGVNNVIVGDHGSGTLTVNNGGQIYLSTLLIASGCNADGTVNLDNGGRINFSGGSLAAGDGLATFNFGGGIIRVSNTDLSISAALNLACGTISTIDTNGFNATVSNSIYGVGGLEKDGLGNLTLTSCVTYSGDTNVTGGVLVFDGSAPTSGMGDLYVGAGGPLIESAHVIFENGGYGNFAEITISNTANATDSMVVDDSEVAARELFTVGNIGSGTLTVTNGGAVDLAGADSNGVALILGSQAGSNGSLIIDGTGESSVIGGPIVVGDYGNASVSITNAGYMETNGSDNSHGFGAYIGWHGSSNSSVSVDGSDSKWEVSDGPLVVGNWGTGTLSITNGGNVTAINDNGDDDYSLYIGRGRHGVGTVNVADASSSLTVNNGGIFVGESGNGNLMVTNGGYLNLTGNDSAGFSALIADSANSSGVVLVTDPASHFDAFSAIVVGNGGSGNLTVANGGSTTVMGADSSHVAMYAGNQAGSQGSVYVTGSSSTLTLNAGDLVVGNSGNGTVTVDAGGYLDVQGGNIVLGAQTGSYGELDLNNGGTLKVGGTDGIRSGDGSYAANFAGGTLKLNSNFSTSVSIGLADGTNSTVNTICYTGTINTAIGGLGGLVKAGTGTLVLNGNNTYTGLTTVNRGALIINGTHASAVTVTGHQSVLGGIGTINNDVLLTCGGTIAPGVNIPVTSGVAASLPTLTVNNLAWNVTTSTLVWHLSSTGAGADLLAVTGNLTNTGSTSSTITFDFGGTGYFDGVTYTTYTLITSNNDLSQQFNLSQFAFTNVGVTVNDVQPYFLFGNGGTSLQFVLVPEPATWGLLAGGAMLLLALRRKRVKA